MRNPIEIVQHPLGFKVIKDCNSYLPKDPGILYIDGQLHIAIPKAVVQKDQKKAAPPIKTQKPRSKGSNSITLQDRIPIDAQEPEQKSLVDILKINAPSDEKQRSRHSHQERARELKVSSIRQSTLFSKLGLETDEIELCAPRYGQVFSKVQFNIMRNAVESETVSGWLRIMTSGNKVPTALPQAFLSNCCMFGGDLHAIEENGREVSIVNHDEDYTKIVDVKLITRPTPDELSRYEKEALKQFHKSCALAEKNGHKLIYHHLPVIDYMLTWGIHLAVQGKIKNFVTLNKYILHVKNRGNLLIEKLQAIAKLYQLNTIIFSPFEFIEPENLNTKNLLNALGLSETEIFQSPGKELEQKFLKNLQQCLKDNPCFPVHQQAWQKITTEFDSLPSLLKTGNTLSIAIPTLVYGHFGVCAIFDNRENPLVYHYNREMSTTFGPIWSISQLTRTVNAVGIGQNGLNQQHLYQYRQDLHEPQKPQTMPIPRRKKQFRNEYANAYFNTCLLHSLDKPGHLFLQLCLMSEQILGASLFEVFGKQIQKPTFDGRTLAFLALACNISELELQHRLEASGNTSPLRMVALYLNSLFLGETQFDTSTSSPIKSSSTRHLVYQEKLDLSNFNQTSISQNQPGLTYEL